MDPYLAQPFQKCLTRVFQFILLYVIAKSQNFNLVIRTLTLRGCSKGKINHRKTKSLIVQDPLRGIPGAGRQQCMAFLDLFGVNVGQIF